jgi:hypothetical protein
VINPNNDTYALRNIQTGSCLYDFYIRDKLQGVRTAPCDYTAPWQQYKKAAVGDLYNPIYFDYTNMDSGYCLDSNFGTGGVGSVYETPCNLGPWQSWQIG